VDEAPAGNAGQDAESLSGLLGISKLMVMHSDLGGLLEHIMEHAARVTNAERATLYVYSDTTHELTSYIAQGAEVSQIRLPLSGGIAGHVARTRQTLNLEDAYASDMFDPSWDERTGFRTRSVLCVPMLRPDGGLVGVIQVLNNKDGVFDADDETTLSLFASHAAIAIDNAKLHEDLKLVFKSAIRALAEAVDQRDPVTAGHSERVTFYAVRLGRAMGLDSDAVETLECAALLHDIGKIAIPDTILTKAARLTDEEYRVMKRHAASTREILQQFHFTGTEAGIPAIAGDHHERLDGSGYPRGLSGESLSLSAKILAVADVYDAVTSFDRAYRRALTPEEGLQLLRDEAGERLDAEVIETFSREELFNIERRRFVRIDKRFRIEYKILPRDRYGGDATPRLAQTRDISGSGLLFLGEDFIPVGFLLDVTVHVDEAEFHLLARAIRSERIEHLGKYEVAIAFLNLSTEAQDRLQEYLVDVT